MCVCPEIKKNYMYINRRAESKTNADGWLFCHRFDVSMRNFPDLCAERNWSVCCDWLTASSCQHTLPIKNTARPANGSDGVRDSLSCCMDIPLKLNQKSKFFYGCGAEDWCGESVSLMSEYNLYVCALRSKGRTPLCTPVPCRRGLQNSLLAGVQLWKLCDSMRICHGIFVLSCSDYFNRHWNDVSRNSTRAWLLKTKFQIYKSILINFAAFYSIVSSKL